MDWYQSQSVIREIFKVDLKFPEKTGNLSGFKSMMEKQEKSTPGAWRSSHVHRSYRSRVFIQAQGSRQFCSATVLDES